jgi:hypothetical protein
LDASEGGFDLSDTNTLVIYKIDGPGYGTATITLEEWREADIIINDKHKIIKDSRTNYPYKVIPAEKKKEHASDELIESAKMIKHVFDEDDEPPMPVEDITEDD